MAEKFSIEAVLKLVDEFTEPAKKAMHFGEKMGLVSAKTQAVGKAMGKVVGAVKDIAIAGAAIGGVGLGMFALARSASEAGDASWKASQKVGINVEKFQELAWAAKLADVEQESLVKGLQKLNVASVAAVRGGKEQAEAFRAVGLSTADLKRMKPDEVLAAVAEKFSHMKDGAVKTALAIKIFGKAGAEMIPLLNAGKKGLSEAADEARRLGIVIDEETAKKSEEFNDNVTRLMTSIKGLGIQIGAGLIPLMNDLVTTFTQFIAKNKDDILQKFREGIGWIKDHWAEIKSGIIGIGEGILGIGRAALWVVDQVGGFKTFLYLIAGVMGLNAVASILLLTQALWGLATALWANPVVAIIGGIAVAALLIYKYWEPISKFFADMWKGIKDAFVDGWAFIRPFVEKLAWAGQFIPGGGVFKSILTAGDMQASAMMPGSQVALGPTAPPPPGFAARGASTAARAGYGTQKVDVTIRNENAPKGQRMEVDSSSPGVRVDAYTGYSLAGAM